jgi:predicted MPP superfamily phosphohydrolase
LNRRQFIRLAAAGLAGLVGSYPVFIERYIVQFNRYRLRVPNLPAAFAGLTIVQLTDLHYGVLVPLAFLKGLIDRVNALQKDMIVCTGDYVHERKSTRQVDRIWPLLATLSAPLGVHSVLGNHDHWASTERSLHWLAETGQGLRRQVRPIERGGERLWLVGAGDLWEDHVDLDALLKDVPADECRIVLAHNPDTADTPHRARVDLMLSGHTHGGQVDIPFLGTPIVPTQNKAYNHGLKRSPLGELVFICRGVGWAVLPVRFNCFPEVAIIEVHPV